MPRKKVIDTLNGESDAIESMLDSMRVKFGNNSCLLMLAPVAMLVDLQKAFVIEMSILCTKEFPVSLRLTSAETFHKNSEKHTCMLGLHVAGLTGMLNKTGELSSDKCDEFVQYAATITKRVNAMWSKALLSEGVK